MERKPNPSAFFTLPGDLEIRRPLSNIKTTRFIEPCDPMRVRSGAP
jgi:hypothetical protein